MRWHTSSPTFHYGVEGIYTLVPFTGPASNYLGFHPIHVTDTMANMNIPANDAPAKQAHVIAPPTKTDILINALDITPTNDNNPFVALPSSDTVIEYVNTLGYPSTLRNMSAISNIDYAKRIWEEFVQSIQTFLTDKKNLATASRGKKKTTHLLIPSIRYVRKDGREVFGMLIPDALHTNEIKRAPYYDEYQEHVAKYQQHLDAKHGKAVEGGSTESSKATKKTLDEPSPAKRSKGGLVRKIRKPMRLVKLVDELSAEDVPSLPEVQGKGKEKFVKEQPAHDPLTLQNLKNKSPIDHFIFQRHTLMPAEASEPAESPSLDAKLALIDSETESDDEVPMINTGDQDEGQTRPNPEATDASHLQNPEQLDEEFTTTAYLNVQENLKLPSKDPLEPCLLCKTLKKLSFTNQFFMKKQQEEEPGKTNAKAEEILQQRMFEDKSYKAHEDHKKLYDVLENLLERNYSNQLLSDLEEACQKKRKRRDVPRTPSGSPPPQPQPPPPSPLAGASGAPGSKALSSSKSAASAPQSMAWTTSDIRYELAGLYGTQELSPTDSLIPNDSIPDEQTNPKGDQVRIDVNRPLPLGGPPGYVTIQSQFFFNKELGYLRHGSKGSSPALSVSKMKAASYPNFDLELLVPEQMWIEDVCTYDISHLDHLPGSDKKMLSTAVKLWTQNLVIRQWVEDFQLGNMVLEFLFSPHEDTFSDTQNLFDVFMDEAINGNSEIEGYARVEGNLSRFLGWIFDYPNIH
nr:hypothetical protein [Tanacetum cinerariifolium]